MKIDVYSDMVCPWCRIGKKNMTDAIARWAEVSGETVPVTFHAFQLNPEAPAEGEPFREMMETKMGGADRLGPMLQRVTDAGAEIGLTFRFDKVERMANTLLAHRVTSLLPAELQPQWVDAVMNAYFQDGRDISQLSVLLEVAAAVGADTEELGRKLGAGEGSSETQRDFDTARGLGITGVPFFVINDQFALSGAYPASQFLAAFQKISEQEAKEA